MSKKDFDEYYLRVQKQYSEMKDTLDQFELMSTNNLVSSQQIDAIKATMQPIKDNYMIISNIAYILNKPNKKTKQIKYQRSNISKMKNIDSTKSLQNIVNSNEKNLFSMKKQIEACQENNNG